MKRVLALLVIIFSLMMAVAFTNEENASANASKIGIDDNQYYSEKMQNNFINIQIGDYLFTATLVYNSTTEALKEMLLEGPITIVMRDYANMEKVGSFGTNLPRNDESITTEAGDLILYKGSAFVIYYESNSWNFTRIGKINNVTKEELKEALGSGDVTVTLSLNPNILRLNAVPLPLNTFRMAGR